MNDEPDWDAGGMGCGELVMLLRMRLLPLPPGTRFTVRATDAAAPEDIPAWCRLTRHALVSARHPIYVIQRREN
ncbi:sulfurtransferase TusA family protein [Gemmata sp. JC673]|uniref:Sulfurtransferase TusA family protein n=1 Tax=Gemmata algarum TaxID=2975278 RepID=A0ABU5F3M6_9BACT|nr:sulfurtransferase TusA family protein [Gemmata algarum]MDY3562104.1 sulfurtransferase TusA family protein [Gemmata algarum]